MSLIWENEFQYCITDNYKAFDDNIWNGISYYVLNRASCEEVIEKYLSPVSEFDRDRRFLSSDNLAFREIYLRDRIEYKVYTSGEVNGIKVPKKH
jgi:hypothetical protein